MVLRDYTFTVLTTKYSWAASAKSLFVEKKIKMKKRTVMGKRRSYLEGKKHAVSYFILIINLLADFKAHITQIFDTFSTGSC